MYRDLIKIGDANLLGIPDDLRNERREDRFAARYEDHNTGDGVRVSNKQKRATAKILKG